MNIKNKLRYIYKENKKERRKKIAIIVLLLLIIMVIYGGTDTMFHYLSDNVMKSYNYQNLSVTYVASKDDRETAKENLRKIEHITDVFEYYENEVGKVVTKVGDVDYDGTMLLHGLDEKKFAQLAPNTNEENAVVCSEIFYPNNDLEGNNLIPRNQFIDMRKNIGKTIQAEYYERASKSYKPLELKIVGTVPNSKIELDECVCYTSRENMRKIEALVNEGYENNNSVADLLVSVDKEKNVIPVMRNIEKINYAAGRMFLVNVELFQFLSNLRVYTIILCCIFALLFIRKIQKSNLEYKKHNYGILKSMGLNDKDYFQILCLENMITLINSFIITAILLLIIYLILHIVIYFYPIIFLKMKIWLNFKIFIIFYLYVAFILFSTTYLSLRKIRKINIAENLGD